MSRRLSYTKGHCIFVEPMFCQLKDKIAQLQCDNIQTLGSSQNVCKKSCVQCSILFADRL